MVTLSASTCTTSERAWLLICASGVVQREGRGGLRIAAGDDSERALGWSVRRKLLRDDKVHRRGRGRYWSKTGFLGEFLERQPPAIGQVKTASPLDSTSATRQPASAHLRFARWRQKRCTRAS